MTSKNVKHANTFFTMTKYGTFQECPHYHWTPINHQLNHHIYAAHLKILPTIRAKRIIWTHSLIVKKKSQMKENAPSVKTNRCHRRSINLGKWSCTINWDKLVEVWMKEIGKKDNLSQVGFWNVQASSGCVLTLTWTKSRNEQKKTTFQTNPIDT